MVREIILVQIGQCGNQIGNVFWETMSKEHQLLEDGSFAGNEHKDKEYIDKINVYYEEPTHLRFVPRSILVDLEPGALDVIKACPMGKMFKPDNFVFGANGAANNYAKGHYTEGASLIDEVLDIVRHEIEACDCPQGFQITQSIGGGTGSGLGSLLLLKVRENFPDIITCTFSVYPSNKTSDVVVEPYNAILSINQLLENSDETFVIDNEALFNISQNILKQNHPSYKDLNWVISCVMCGITASLRFSGKLNCDLRKLGVNLIPFPRLHFFLVGQAPLFAEGEGEKVNLTVAELTEQIWSARNILVGINPADGKYLAASCAYRGNISTQAVDDEICKIQCKLSDDFVSYIPNNIKSSIINVAPVDTEKSATFVANTTAIKGVFERISASYMKLFKRKAFLHWYTGEGMDEMEFQNANTNVLDLVMEYQEKQEAILDADDYSSSDYEDGDEDVGDGGGVEEGDVDVVEEREENVEVGDVLDGNISKNGDENEDASKF